MAKLNALRLTGLVALLSGAPVWAADDDRLGSAFGPGEQCTYAVEFLGIRAGSAQITVGSEMNHWGKTVWPIVALAKSESLAALYPIRDKFITYWDHANQRTIGSDLYAEENRRRRRQQIRLDATAGVAQVMKQREGSQAVEETHEVGAEVQDVAAAAFALRNQDLRVGETYEIPVFTGARSFDLRATVEGKETVKTRIGKQEVFKVRIATQFSGKLATKRDLYVYLTTDRRHVPVKLEADFAVGSVVGELVDYKPGRQLSGPATASVAD